jgi:hypothetical protein
MRLGVPFIAPRQLGAVESISRRQFLPSVNWRTGQSGAPPDTVRCGSLSLFGEADRCRFLAVGAPDIVRCTPDTVRCTPDTVRCTPDTVRCTPDTVRCTPDTVRCTLLIVGSTTRRARITRPTVGPADCWLTEQSCAPPDSPVIYSRTPLIASREQPVDRHRPGTPDIVRCTTGHCPVHPDRAVFG